MENQNIFTQRHMFSKQLRSLLIIVGIVVGVTLTMAILAKPGTVYAAGGVGPGGSGGSSGTGPEAHWTYKGWGWASYDTSGPGPRDGFRNGTSWSTVQNTCQAAGATKIYSHIILDSYGKAMIYDYASIQYSPYVYGGLLPNGISIDDNRAVTIDVSTAQDAYNSLSTFGVDTSGYAFGVNVAWFCYDFVAGGTIQTAKYFPDSEPNDGPDTGEYPAVINDALVCWTSSLGGIICNNNANPWALGGVRTSGNPNTISVNVPTGYRVTKTNGRPFSCTGADNTGTCRVTGVNVAANTTTFVDFWFEKIDVPPVGVIDSANCSSIRGWAFDPDYPNASIEIHIYAKYPNGTSAGSMRGRANLSRPDVNAAYSITGNHGFNIDVSDWDDAYINSFEVWAIGTSSNSGDQDVTKANTLLGARSIGPCAKVTCEPNIEPEGNVEVGRPFRLRLTVTYSEVGSRGRGIHPNSAIGIDEPWSPTAGLARDTWPFADTKTGGSHLYPTVYTVPIDDPGEFFIRSRITQADSPLMDGSGVFCDGDDDPSENPPPPKAVYKPYFKVYGNDVAAGGAYDNDLSDKELTCDASGVVNDKATILGWASPNMSWSDFESHNWPIIPGSTAESWGGSSVEMASFAMGEIVGYYTASQHNLRRFQGADPSIPTAVTGLSFGNYNGNERNYTISYVLSETVPPSVLDERKVIGSGGRAWRKCLPRYYKTTPAGNVTLSGPQSGTRYVNGNVMIPNNITLNEGAGWSLATKPSFYLVVKGNIYIHHNVTQLDGVYIAEPDENGNGGKIYTCMNGGANNPSFVPNAHSTCNRQLVFNGAVVAKTIKLQRTTSTVSASVPSPPPQLGLRWSTIGPISGMACVQMNEPADPATWEDNYLCWSKEKDLQLKWTFNGAIPAGHHCTRVNEPSEPSSTTWPDNYLCWPTSKGGTDFLRFSYGGPDPRRQDEYCTSIDEPADPHPWRDNYICEKIQLPATQSSGEYYNTPNNAAEIFNAGPELYLGAPEELVKEEAVEKFDYMTSLPPLL